MALLRPPLFRRYERTSGHQARPALAPQVRRGLKGLQVMP